MHMYILISYMYTCTYIHTCTCSMVLLIDRLCHLDKYNNMYVINSLMWITTYIYFLFKKENNLQQNESMIRVHVLCRINTYSTAVHV